MNKKVLLVGWDAADWKVITPLMERNLMPATRRLVEQGVMGQMATLSPALSPMLWTSIATGKRPYKHGILGFAEPGPAGGVQPITNLSRKTKAIWNILGQNGFRSNVVGWWPSHPAEPINGVMVSDHYHRAPGPIERGWPMRPGTVHPQQLAETLAELRVHPQELAPEHILPFIPHAARIDQDTDHRMESCIRTLADCSTVQSCATHLMEHEPWDFMAVYFDSIDHFCHLFMRYHPPQQEWIKDDDFDLYQHVVTAGYVYHDMMLARLIELAGPDATVILMSDHGFHPDQQRRRTLPSEPAGPAAEHRDFGIFVMQGPGIKRDELVHGVNLLDVTPTLLTLFGLPVGEDMDGRPLVDAFEERPTVARIPSWDDVAGDDGRHPPDRHLTAADAREGIEQLVALGYIDRPSGDQAQAVRETVRELNYNLARSYMDAGLHGLAVPLLIDLYREYPLEFRFGIQLAVCLQSLGVVNDLERLIDDLNTRWRHAAREARRRLSDIAKLARDRREARDSSATVEAKTSRDELFSEAEQALIRKLKSIARGNPSTLDLLAGWVATARKQPDEALTFFTRAGKTQSRVPGFHLQLGDAYLALGRYEEAEACFQRVLDIDAVSPGAYLGLAKMFLRRRQPKQALDAATRAISFRYHLPPAHYYLGLAKLGVRDVDGALDAFQVALSQNPNFAEVHGRLARIYSQVFKDEGQAITHRVMAMQIRNERRRQARARVIPELPPVETAHYEDHLPVFPTTKKVEGRLPSLSEPPDAGERAVRGENSSAEQAVVIVSGLPRSGTSMMMQMLVAGGIQPVTDGDRPADASNPQGYFELTRVKQLPQRNDWLDESRGRCLKVVAPLIPHLPQRVACRVIVMNRDLDEIVASQHRMLERGHQESAKLTDAQLKTFLRQQLAIAIKLLEAHGVPTMVVSYAEALQQPALIAERVQDFLGRPLELSAMSRVVNSMLYRERAATAAIS